MHRHEGTTALKERRGKCLSFELFSQSAGRTSYMSSSISCTPEYLSHHMHVSNCQISISGAELRFRPLIKVGSRWLSERESADGHPRRCRNQSCGFSYTVFLTTAPASCQRRFNCSTAAPCSRQSPAQVPFIVSSIINKEWKAPGERAWRCRQYQSPQKCKLRLWQWGQMYFNFNEPEFRAALLS